MNQMDQNDNEDCISEFLETYASGVYGPLQSLPGVGEEYQIEIPSLNTDSGYLDYIKNPIVEEETDEDLPSNFLIGIDISIVWIYHEPQNVKNDNVVSLVPGYALESWNELERDSFLLGLYIFEKDFAWLKWFIKSKTTGIYRRITMLVFISLMNIDDGQNVGKVEGEGVYWKENILSGLRQQEFIVCLVLMYLKIAIIPLLRLEAKCGLNGRYSSNMERFFCRVLQTLRYLYDSFIEALCRTKLLGQHRRG